MLSDPFPTRRSAIRWFSGLMMLGVCTTSVWSEERPSLQAPPGFKVTEYADDSLAHDIFSLTVDTLGRVVVSGPGYVKILIDSDQDGKADKVKKFADGPKTGAQGMYWVGRDLLCVGDEGLIRFKDENFDDRADGPAETFLKIKAGGEHHAHAIRRGPDGWWWLIVGNMCELDEGYATLKKTSPVLQPEGGAILRLKPDLTGGEIFCDGFRNAYDFDFNADGEVFSYDSDGERDISLPWYLPTRLFHSIPGANHGWVTDNWKRPNYFLDASPVVAATGRGSPTGVACYRHNQFPAEFQNSIFMLDWTFGRVWNVPLQKTQATSRGEPRAFITATGENGFAPTDLDVGPDGSLYIAVGGRGTHGTVYRVVHEASVANQAAPVDRPAEATLEQKLEACLAAPQPLASWSRARWVPLAKALDAPPFLAAALNERLPIGHRVRAVEILAELFQGLPGPAVEILAKDRDAALRARVAWSLGVKPVPEMPPPLLAMYLNDSDALVRRRAVEALRSAGVDLAPLTLSLARCLGDESREVRIATARLYLGLPAGMLKPLSDAARQVSWKAALTNALGLTWRVQSEGRGYSGYGIEIGRRILTGEHPNDLKLEAVRLMQISLGDMGGAEETPPVFDGYVSQIELEELDRDLDALRIELVNLFPLGERELNLELSRLTAMAMPPNPEILEKLLAQITDDSLPSDDVHYLLCMGRIPVARGKSQREATARALVGIDAKMARLHWNTDNNWNDRISELYTRLVELDSELPARLLAQPGFGRPGHVIYMSKMGEADVPQAVEAFVKAIAANADYAWNNDVVFLLGAGKKPEVDELLRKQSSQFALRMAVLLALADRPEERDREMFASGLDFAPLEVLTACVGALEKLPPSRDPQMCLQLVKLLRRLGRDKNEYPLRERVVKLLERSSGESVPFVPGEPGHQPQIEMVTAWTAWLLREFPEFAQSHLGAEAEVADLTSTLEEVPWAEGDAARGRKLYTSKGCAQCHSGGSGLGPDLAGAGGRFSRNDLFLAIALPNRDVSPRYQTTVVETKQGKLYTGLVVYESVDGVLLRNGANQTFRIAAAEIESRNVLPTSLMPSGLLKDLQKSDLADLYAYLKGLGMQTAEQPTTSRKE